MFQLEEKYPNLHGILQSTPMDEIILRVDQDRLRSTYQVDFSEKGKECLKELVLFNYCMWNIVEISLLFVNCTSLEEGSYFLLMISRPLKLHI